MRGSRALAVALALTALVATGCGDDDNQAGAGGGGGAGGQTLRLGLLVPLTGPAAKTAQEMENTAKLAAGEIGEATGQEVVIETYDTALEPQTAAREAQRAVTRDDVHALIGGFTTDEGLAIKEIAERLEVPYIATSPTADQVTEDATYTYRIAPVLSNYAPASIDAAKALGIKRPAILHDAGGAGQLISSLWVERAKATGMEIAGDLMEYPIDATDVTTQVTNAKRNNPDGVLIGGTGGGLNGLIVKTMAEQGLDVPALGVSPILTPDARAIGGAAYAELPGVYGVEAVDTDKPAYKALLKAYNGAHDKVERLTEQPTQNYDGVKVIAAAAERAGGTEPEQLLEALNTMAPYEDAAAGREGSTIQFTEDDHNGYQGQYAVAYQVHPDGLERLDVDF